MQTITIAPPKRSWFSLLSWAIVLAVLVVSWQGAEMAPLTLIKDGGNMATFAADFFPPDFSQWQDYLTEMAVTLQIAVWGTALAKLAVSEPLDTTEMRLERRISAVYKDIPGGQLLGPTYDYTHRLLDFTLLANGEAPTLTTADSAQQPSPHVFSLLARQGLAKFEEDSGAQPDDITRTPPVYPCSRSSRLQQLMRGDEGYLLALAYSTQRGYGRNHPFAGEIRSGYIDVSIVPEELGFAVNVGELLITECEMVNGFIDPPDEPPHFTRGYGLVFGMSERKAMAMALVDRALQAPEYGEHATGPAQDEEFVLAHADNVEAAGFVSHLKLPHYVDFQAELELLKRLQQEQNHG
ncbi:carbon-phosphorus lyase complex subunit PhnI [Escherichia coli]|nr:carbon-phosphorus lyase complex subunit PhnI [Escherichia coli]